MPASAQVLPRDGEQRLGPMPQKASRLEPREPEERQARGEPTDHGTARLGVGGHAGEPIGFGEELGRRNDVVRVLSTVRIDFQEGRVRQVLIGFKVLKLHRSKGSHTDKGAEL